MFDGTPHRSELLRRIEVVRRILAASANAAQSAPELDVTRESRGIAIVLLFAAYENLLTGLCRSLLEVALRLRVGNGRLKQGLRLFAVYSELQSLRDSSTPTIWKHSGPRVVQKLDGRTKCTINAELFPADGSFMKRSQVTLFCDLFELGDPGPVLREVWGHLDAVVTQRNGIAHGRMTPEEVGRNYSSADLDALVESWLTRWTEFVDLVEGQATARDFYRLSR